MTATTRVAQFLQDCGGIGGQSEHSRVLGDSGDGSSSDSLTLFSSPEHEGFVNSAKTDSLLRVLSKLRIKKDLLSEALSLSFSLLKPHGELTLGHLEVLDVGSGAIEKRDLAGLLVGDGERIFEAAVTLPEFVTPALL